MEKINRQDLVALILKRLSFEQDRLAFQFTKSHDEVGVRYCFVDQLLPDEIARLISTVFPMPFEMRYMNSFREKKYTSKQFNKYNPLLESITFAIQDPKVVSLIEKITGITNQIPDSGLYAGGLSAMRHGNFLGPHLDNSHDGSRKHYRTLNLLYYVSPNWSLECGGNLELWDSTVRKNVTIVSKFNRLAIMETTPVSWHSVSKVRTDSVRKCISNYYFSKDSPTGEAYFNVTSFSAPPDQPVRRVLASLDNCLRQVLRKVVPNGLGRKDIYQGQKK